MFFGGVLRENGGGSSQLFTDERNWAKAPCIVVSWANSKAAERNGNEGVGESEFPRLRLESLT